MSRKPDPRHNRLCQRCARSCKQPKHVVIISCPDFEAQPVQLTIPLKFPPGRPKKHK
jgi:hypothetical protein